MILDVHHSKHDGVMHIRDAFPATTERDSKEGCRVVKFDVIHLGADEFRQTVGRRW